jgi:hypothetical protein
MPKPGKKQPPPTSVFGWLGRQIGHVKRAVKADVTKPAPAKPPPTPKPRPKPKAKPKVVYRDNKVEEVDHPTQPGVKLRRTVIDEVIVDDPNKRIG